MSFDSFLSKVKAYGRVFLAGFAAAAASYLVRHLYNGNFSIEFYTDKHFYYEGLIGGLLYLLIDIVDDFLVQISFMRSLYNQLPPIYYSLVAPVLLAAVLGIAVPMDNLFLKKFRRFNLNTAFNGFTQKYKNTLTYMMIRMLADSLAHMLQTKYLSTFNSNIEIITYIAVSIASACVSESAYTYFFGSFVTKGIVDEAIFMGPYALVTYLISGKCKYIPFSHRLL